MQVYTGICIDIGKKNGIVTSLIRLYVNIPTLQPPPATYRN